MRRALLVLPLLLATSVLVRGDEQRPTSEHQTTVRGTVPDDVVGRWLVVGWLDLPKERHRTTTYFWEIARPEGDPVQKMHYAWLPEGLQEAVNAANKAGEIWRPAPEQIADIAKAWNELPPWRGAPPVRVETEFIGADAFDDELKNDDSSKNALWVVRQTFTFQQTPTTPYRQVSVYAVREAKDANYVGGFRTLVVLPPPLPVPFNLAGTFEMYRLVQSPGSLWERLLDVFSGCGRK
jgi:hypothetical protein